MYVNISFKKKTAWTGVICLLPFERAISDVLVDKQWGKNQLEQSWYLQWNSKM